MDNACSSQNVDVVKNLGCEDASPVVQDLATIWTVWLMSSTCTTVF